MKRYVQGYRLSNGCNTREDYHHLSWVSNIYIYIYIYSASTYRCPPTATNFPPKAGLTGRNYPTLSTQSLLVLNNVFTINFSSGYTLMHPLETHHPMRLLHMYSPQTVHPQHSLPGASVVGLVLPLTQAMLVSKPASRLKSCRLLPGIAGESRNFLRQTQKTCYLLFSSHTTKQNK